MAMASGAADILARARIVDTLAEALDGIHHVCATAMTPRDFGPPTWAPREHFATLQPTRAARGLRLRLGALRPVQRRCLPLPRLPEHSHRPGLRLAEPGAGGATHRLRMAPWRWAASPWAPRTPRRCWPMRAAVQGTVEHWAACAGASWAYLDPAAPKKLMPRLQQLLNRAQLTQRGGAHPARHRARRRAARGCELAQDVRRRGRWLTALCRPLSRCLRSLSATVAGVSMQIRIDAPSGLGADDSCRTGRSAGSHRVVGRWSRGGGGRPQHRGVGRIEHARVGSARSAWSCTCGGIGRGPHRVAGSRRSRPSRGPSRRPSPSPVPRPGPSPCPATRSPGC